MNKWKRSKPTPSGIVIQSNIALAPHDPSLAALFRRACETQPARTVLAQHENGEWTKLSYEDAWHRVQRLGPVEIEDSQIR